MEALAFDNPHGQKMKHPGTYNANPLSAAAGVAALDIVATAEPSNKANESAAKLRQSLNQIFAEKSSRLVAYGDFSAIKIHADFEGPHPTTDDEIPFGGDWRRLDIKADGRLGHAFRCALLLGGVDWFGWGGSTSLAHSDADISQTTQAFSNAIDMLREDRFNV
jgi:glutamate-1-semialdehyde 2,1-aminomutase